MFGKGGAPMFALKPWRKEKRAALLPRVEPFGMMADEFPVLFNRLMHAWPLAEMTEWPYGWDVTTEKTDKEIVIRLELPGFELEEIKVLVTPEALTVEAEHKEPVVETKEETEKKEKVTDKPEGERTYVKHVESLPPEIDPEKVVATYRNGILEVHLPRKEEAVGRRVEVKT